jgi:hypothetical protein
MWRGASTSRRHRPSWATVYPLACGLVDILLHHFTSSATTPSHRFLLRSTTTLPCHCRPLPLCLRAVRPDQKELLNALSLQHRFPAQVTGYRSRAIEFPALPSSFMHRTIADDLLTSSSQANASRSSARLPCSSSTTPSPPMTRCSHCR